jgi:hypothetical protein
VTEGKGKEGDGQSKCAKGPEENREERRTLHQHEKVGPSHSGKIGLVDVFNPSRVVVFFLVVICGNRDWATLEQSLVLRRCRRTRISSLFSE